MNDIARQQLQLIIKKRGKQICADPRLVEALLRDYCSECKTEINILVQALKEGVARQIDDQHGYTLPFALLNRLSRQLEENHAMTSDAANWAVESWAVALGIHIEKVDGKGPEYAGTAQLIKREPANQPEPGIDKKESVIFSRGPKNSRKRWIFVAIFVVALVTIGLIFIVSQFKAQPLAPTPILSSPPDNSSEVSVERAVFSWAESIGAGKYKIVIAKDAELSQIIREESTGRTVYPFTGKFDSGTTYYWCVQVVQPAGSRSEVWRFTTEAANPNAASITAVTQSDNRSTGFDSYAGILPGSPLSQSKILFWSLRDAMWSWDWKTKKNRLSDYNYEIYIMDPDGKNQVNLTNNTARDFIPRLSPDGTKILFVSDRKWATDSKWDDNWDIFVMDYAGGNIRNLTGRISYDTMPCWSPDGDMIVFCSAGAAYKGYQVWEIWVMDAEGHNFLNLTPARDMRMSFYPTWPSWSPDGTKILFNSYEEGTYDISVMEIDYNRVKQIVLNPNPANYTGQSWSTTGERRIVKPTYKQFEESEINTLVKATRKLTLNPTGWDGGAYWSPDGKKIAYVSSRKVINTQISDIYVMNSDGSNPINLTKTIDAVGEGGFNDWPSWSPDGKKIAFVSDSEGQELDFGVPFKYSWQIFVMDADGSNVKRLTNNNYVDGSPNWGIVTGYLAGSGNKLTPPPQSATPVEDSMSAQDLKKIHSYFGKRVMVEGKVVDWGNNGDIESRPIMLYFENANQHCRTYDEWLQSSCGTDFRVVVTQKDSKRFPDMYSYLNKTIRVTGVIDYYKSAPAIIAHDPEQISIIAE